MDLEKNAILYIKDIFQYDFSGHDFWHSVRVYKNAMSIAQFEVCNQRVIMLGSLLHDVDDKKLFKTDNYNNARNFMENNDIDEITLLKVIDAIKTVSYSENKSIIPKTIEAKIIQDADRLDAIGAIGIARAFAFGGNIGRGIYDPEYQKHNEYKYTTLDHFNEKLFRLKSMMNTETAKKWLSIETVSCIILLMNFMKNGMEIYRHSVQLVNTNLHTILYGAPGGSTF